MISGRELNVTLSKVYLVQAKRISVERRGRRRRTVNPYQAMLAPMLDEVAWRRLIASNNEGSQGVSDRVRTLSRSNKRDGDMSGEGSSSQKS